MSLWCRCLVFVCISRFVPSHISALPFFHSPVGGSVERLQLSYTEDMVVCPHPPILYFSSDSSSDPLWVKSLTPSSQLQFWLALATLFFSSRGCQILLQLAFAPWFLPIYPLNCHAYLNTCLKYVFYHNWESWLYNIWAW